MSRTQGLVAAGQQDPQPDPPGTIDGSVNPELIPDAVAYGLLFLAVAEPENPTSEQRARAWAKISAAGLTETDFEALLLVLGKLHQEIGIINARLNQIRDHGSLDDPSSPDVALAIQLGMQFNKLLAETTTILPTRLSRDGIERLHSHLQNAKRGMKVLPDTMMIPK